MCRAGGAVVPEVDFSVGYQLFRWARLSVGYNFLYCSSVLRPGDQLDRTVSPTLLPSHPAFNPASTAANPAPLFKSTDFWAQGLNFGLSVSF